MVVHYSRLNRLRHRCVRLQVFPLILGQFPWEGSSTVLLRRYKFVTIIKMEMGKETELLLSLLFIYFWLRWVFVAAHAYRLLIVVASLVAEHRL